MNEKYELKSFKPEMSVYLMRIRTGSTEGAVLKEHTVKTVGRKYVTLENGEQYFHKYPDDEYLVEKIDTGWKTLLFRSEEDAIRYQEKEMLIRWFDISAAKTLRRLNVSLEAMKKAKAIIEGTEK